MALLGVACCSLACGARLVEIELDHDAGAMIIPSHPVDVIELRTTTQSIDAPDYLIDITTLALLTDADRVVQEAVGSVELSTGSIRGQRYVVVDAANLRSYRQLDDAFGAADDVELTLRIPAAVFALANRTLTSAWTCTLIIANASDGVRSYQAFEITFHPPT